jgi:hypothetical protein
MIEKLSISLDFRVVDAMYQCKAKQLQNNKRGRVRKGESHEWK